MHVINRAMESTRTPTRRRGRPHKDVADHARRVMITLPPELVERAKRVKTPFSRLVRHAIEQYLDGKDRPRSARSRPTRR